MRPVTSVMRPASTQGNVAGCVIFRPMDWWSRIVNTENITGLPRRIDRNEYNFALLYIVRQVTILYSARSFGGTPRCFDVLKSRARTLCTVSRMRADPDVLGAVNTGHRCDSQKISVSRCEYYRS